MRYAECVEMGASLHSRLKGHVKDLLERHYVIAEIPLLGPRVINSLQQFTQIICIECFLNTFSNTSGACAGILLNCCLYRRYHWHISW